MVRCYAFELDLSRTGQAVMPTTHSEVLGDPAASVAWLANKLAEFGHSLETGMQVMSGSFTR